MPDYQHNGVMVYAGGPVDTLARTLWGEARGEPVDGVRGVADVIANRASKPRWWGKSIVEVCRKRGQFSCWNLSDPNRAKIDALTVEDASFRRCLDVAIGVVADSEDGSRVDTVDGATHYHTTAVSPAWAAGKTPCARIGHHLFYNNVE